MMPGMDGYEVCRKLKDIPATRDVPIIFLTAKTEEVDEEKGFDVGAVDYIHKPFSGPIVLARVRTQLALQEALIEAQEAREQADLLLHALLPKKAADEIRSIGTVIPRRYENVAVLVLRRDQLHGVLRQARARGRGVAARCAVRHLRADHGEARPREDQDDWRWVHGGCRAAAQGQ